MANVLVTGGSGFVGAHTIVQLLAAGHEVRTTVRALDREGAVRAMVTQGGVEAGSRLTFAVADLTSDAGWADAVKGCDYVLHVASPLPEGGETDAALIGPAREGTLRVLRAARDAGVRRVVLTSSFAAVGYGATRTTPFDETAWTDPETPGLQPYMKSKTLAERTAWDFIVREGRDMELCVINPTGIFGPALGPDFAGSVGIIKRMMDGGMPALPRVYFGVVDVRDVAALHVTAMTNTAAKGERFIAVAGETLSLLDIARILRQRLGDKASRVPRLQMPDFVFRLMALRNLQARLVLPQLGKVRHATSAKARGPLGWSPRASEEAIIASAESLLRLGLVKGGGGPA